MVWLVPQMCNPTYSIIMDSRWFKDIKYGTHNEILQWPLVVAPCSGLFNDARRQRFGWIFRDPPPPIFSGKYLIWPNMSKYYQIDDQIAQTSWDNTERVPRQYCSSNERFRRQSHNWSTIVMREYRDSTETVPWQYCNSIETVPRQYRDSTETVAPYSSPLS